MERELTFRIVLENPPAGVDFALQKGKGSKYEIVQKQRSGNGDLRFEFAARAALDGRGVRRICLARLYRGRLRVDLCMSGLEDLRSRPGPNGVDG